MENITFSVQAHAIERSRKIAAQKENEEKISNRLKNLWKKTNYLRVGKKLSHDEMNESC